MERLKNCKNFGEIYEVIGEKNFTTIAKLIMAMMVFAPICFGVINYVMLFDIYYDAYSYNYVCMTICNIIFAIASVWGFMYYYGKISLYKLGAKGTYEKIKEKGSWIIWWIALAIWSIVPVCCSVNLTGALLGRSFLGNGYITHLYMLGVLACSSIITGIVEIEDLLKSFVIVTDVLAVIMLAFEFDIPIIAGASAGAGVSVYTNSNHYGYIIVMASMVCCGMYFTSALNKEKIQGQLLYILSFSLNIYALMYNDSLGAYLAIAVTYLIGIVIWVAAGRKIGIWVVVPGVIIIAMTGFSFAGFWVNKLGGTVWNSLVVFWQDLFKVARQSEGYQQAGTSRMELWLDTIDMIKQRPILGHGPDVNYNADGRQLLNTPHNEFLECAFFLGVPGLVLYLGGLISLLINKCKKIKTLSDYELVVALASIGYLASSFVGVRKFNTVCFFFMFMGLLLKDRKSEKEN